MRKILILALFPIGCLSSPSVENATDASADAATDGSSIPDGTQQSDTDAEPGLPDAGDPITDPFPLPAVGSGGTAWWTMDWIAGGANAGGCDSPDPRMAIIAVDDGRMTGSITVSYQRSEQCMYFGGPGSNDLFYHVQSSQFESNLVYTAQGFSIHTRDSNTMLVLKDGDQTIDSFNGASISPPTVIVGLSRDAIWGRGWPMISTIENRDFSLGDNVDGFDNVGNQLGRSLYETESDRNSEMNGTPTSMWNGRFKARFDPATDRHYLSQSWYDGTLWSCEEFWYDQGVGPYAFASYQVNNYEECEDLLAADNDGVNDPVAHFNGQLNEMSGYAIRTNYCLTDCSVE